MFGRNRASLLYGISFDYEQSQQPAQCTTWKVCQCLSLDVPIFVCELTKNVISYDECQKVGDVGDITVQVHFDFRVNQATYFLHRYHHECFDTSVHQIQRHFRNWFENFLRVAFIFLRSTVYSLIPPVTFLRSTNAAFS